MDYNSLHPTGASMRQGNFVGGVCWPVEADSLLVLVDPGMSNQSIAGYFHISVNTVTDHLDQLKVKEQSNKRGNPFS